MNRLKLEVGAKRITVNDEIKNRVNWLDCAKGIAILLVIVGHSIGGLGLELILSFHMPLFFATSAFTFKYSTSMAELGSNAKKSFKRLIIPSLLMYAMYWFILHFVRHPEMLQSFHEIKLYTQERIWALIFASAYGKEGYVYGFQGIGIGILWFMVVLFCGRLLFDFLHMTLSKIYLQIMVVILSIAGVLCSHFLWLPFDLDVVFAVMPFFYFGYWSKEKLFKESVDLWKKFILIFLIWLVTCIIWSMSETTILDLAPRTYTFYPCCYFVAIFGILMVWELSRLVVHYFPNNILCYIGKNSIYLFGIHYFDYAFEFIWNKFAECYFLPIRLCMDLLVFGIVMLGKNYFVRVWRKSDEI